MGTRVMRLVLSVVAAVGLMTLASAAPASATEQAWTLHQISYYKPGCAAGATKFAIDSGPYRGYGKCGTHFTNIYWRSGSYTRQHTFVIGTDNAAWNAVHTYNHTNGDTVSATGWRSLGGQIRTWIEAYYVASPSSLSIRSPALSSGAPYCKHLRSGSWSAWTAC